MRRRRLDFRKSVHAPLVILAGLPNPIFRAVAKSVEDRSSQKPRVISAPSGNNDGQLYRDETVSILINAAGGYAVRHAKAQETPPAPKHIVLAFVPTLDEERLLREFDFFVFPVRLTRLAEYNEGRQRRHDREFTTEYVIDSLETAFREFAELKRRLSTVSDKDPLFMPPQNFEVSPSERIADLFRNMARQRSSWAEPLPAIQQVRVTRDDLPTLGLGVQKVVLADRRGLLFPHDRSEHAFGRELEANCCTADKRNFLRSRFRFGVPLTDGYHHDVQYAGRSLGGETFMCCRDGVKTLTCSHANVYPNDYVRPSKT
jgi:hypothetical protein